VTGPSEQERAVYHEPGRTFIGAWGLGGLIALFWLLDVALGGGRAHAVAFVLVFVVVVGIEVLTTVAARATRSVTVTRSELRVGDHTVARNSIIGYERDVAAGGRVLGRNVGEGLPRGSSGLAVHLADGTSLVVPTREPRKLAAALELAPTTAEIRPAAAEELATLADLEDRADTVFRVAGYGDLPAATQSHEERDPLVVMVAGRPPVGFIRVDEVDGMAHIEQLSVLPGEQRQGLGTSLVEAACTWAAAHGYPAITMLTFRDVPWNAPLFAKLGFAAVDSLTPGLSEARHWERAIGLDAIGPRVALRRELVGAHDDPPRADLDAQDA